MAAPRTPMPSEWNEMAVNGCLSNNTSGESGHWTMASSDAPNHDDDLLEQELLEVEEQVTTDTGDVWSCLVLSCLVLSCLVSPA